MISKRNTPLDRTGREGAALVASLVVVATLVIVAASIFSINLAHKKEVSSSTNETRALYLAEAGVNETLSQISVSVKNKKATPKTVGTYANPIESSAGRFWCEVVDNLDDTYTVTSTGAANVGRCTLQAVIAPIHSGVFDHAIFAGNDSGDPTYTLELGGSGGAADSVTGDIFSGGDVDITGDATVDGELSASGTITGGSGTEGVSLPVPDIAGMDYANNNDFDVADAFATGAPSWTASATLGGSAWQLPQANPAHIFRKNPSDRGDYTGVTAKDDYFLEDPYESLAGQDRDGDGVDDYFTQTITLSGIDGEPGPDGNEAVYYIDGNLWIHNIPFHRIKFATSDGTPIRVTFVVEGNIYFSDDVEMGDGDNDAVAFIAIEDALEPDSGNVSFGDPLGGTLEFMQAFLYAENDFIDNNLDAAGSKTIEVVGNMSAGNHVSIDRDYVNKWTGVTSHSQLTVNFDDRLAEGLVSLPGLPRSANSTAGFGVVFWREIALQ